MITLEVVTSENAMVFKGVRLRALQDTPSAFSSTYADESQLTDTEWLNRVTQWSGKRSRTYLAMDTAGPCGIAGGFFDQDDLHRAHLVSISFDPAHDTPAAITAHAKERGADPRVWSYLTGDAAAIDHVTSRFGISAIDEHDAPESITHNLRTAVIDRQGRLVTIYNGNDWTVDGLLHDLRAQVR